MIRRTYFSAATGIYERFHHHNLKFFMKHDFFFFFFLSLTLRQRNSSPINHEDSHTQLQPYLKFFLPFFQGKWVKMKMICVAFCILLVLLLPEMTQVSSAITCDPLELSACAGAITASTAPSATCCNKLKEQRSCLCQYMKDPNLQKLVNSPNARNVANICGTPFPTC